MGEIAQMMLEGQLCVQCGVCLDEKIVRMNIGIPVYCDDCWKDLLTKESDLLK